MSDPEGPAARMHREPGWAMIWRRIDGGRHPMRIRQALPEDAAALSALARETYIEHFATLWSAAGLAAFLERDFSPPKLADALAADDQTWFIAEDGAGLLGYAKLNWNRVEPLSRQTGAELQKIYFRRHALNHGLGTQTLQVAIQAARARAQPRLWLNVLAPNVAAQRFYLRHGFREIGWSTFHSDAGPIGMIAMERELD